jgi:hypothetical protein
MAFLRFSRDKRGYEHFQLVQPAVNRRGSGRPRILYWFRSPSNVRVGREPFDDAIRIAIEKQNPEVEFDWPQILATPIPSAEADHWRERRRLERAARQLTPDEEEREPTEADTIGHPDVKATPAEDLTVTENQTATADASSTIERPSGAPDGSARRGRRRRRSRRGRPDTDGAKAAEPTVESLEPEPESEPDSEFEGDPE